jgi:hypothetical protein
MLWYLSIYAFKAVFWWTFVLACFVMHANFFISEPPSLQNIATLVSQTE